MSKVRTRVLLTLAALSAAALAVAVALWMIGNPDPVLTELARAIRAGGPTRLLEGTQRLYPGIKPKGEAPAAEQDTVSIDGQTMFRAPMEWRGDDAARIGGILSEADTFEPWQPKKCMGFHADFAVEWQGDAGPLVVLICFGCSELAIVTPSGTKTFNQSWDASWRLLGVLRPYRVNRAPNTGDPWREQNLDGSLPHADADHPHQLESFHGVPRWGSSPN